MNPAQQEAVEHQNGPMLVLAGAGSGKTRVITHRIARLMERGIPAHMICALTFTNKAAAEMAERVHHIVKEQRLGGKDGAKGIVISTFHSFGLMVLGRERASLGGTFTIFDQGDCVGAVKEILSRINANKSVDASAVIARISNAKNAFLTPEELPVREGDEYDEITKVVYPKYQSALRSFRAFDFDDLVVEVARLWKERPDILDRWQKEYLYVLVDEYQDTNRSQLEVLRLLCDRHKNICVVGDDDQSIYAFRGANTANMAEFEREFAHGNVIKLEQNYRSHGHILTAANTLISQNAHRLGKNLWTAEGDGEPVRVFEAYSDQDEASFVVDEVRALNREGMALSEMALLYRSNAQSRVLEHALFSASVPYRVYGGLRFFERQEIKHALAYLRLLTNPEDDGAFLRVVNFPARGIGARTLEQLADTAARSGASLWQAACTSGGKVAGFARLIEEIKASTRDLPLPEAIDHVIEASGLADYYRADKESADRLENLNELINAAALFAEEPASPDAAGSAEMIQPELERFLAHAALEAGEHQAGAGHDALQLMTVHAAKGLEFHAVFITGLEEGLFPHEQSANEENGLEEERRLMYVAITRARRRLYLSHAQSRMLHGQIRYGLPSRFLDELPEQVLLPLNRRSESAASPGYRAPAPMPRSQGQSGNDTGYKVGQSVAHAKFGTGIIIDFEGRGPDARVQVKFRDAGTKWLALAYAKLSPA